MMRYLIGTWRGRLVLLAIVLVTFVISLTATMVVAVGKMPESAMAASRLPVLGPLSVALAERCYGISTAPPPPEPDIETIRDLRPLSSDEINQLMQDLKNQRQVYTDRMADVEKETKRLDLYRKDVAKEREAIDALRMEIVSQWDEIKKAKASLNKEVTDLSGIEEKNIKQLAASYEAMKPDKAAEIVSKLDEATAVKTLFLMRERSAAKVIENLDGDMAARLTERMALVRKSN
jgi:flagellar motility protein MotE (MotC chaperone)